MRSKSPAKHRQVNVESDGNRVETDVINVYTEQTVSNGITTATEFMVKAYLYLGMDL